MSDYYQRRTRSRPRRCELRAACLCGVVGCDVLLCDDWVWALRKSHEQLAALDVGQAKGGSLLGDEARGKCGRDFGGVDALSIAYFFAHLQG